MESVYHIVVIRVNETYWAHVWRLRSLYLGTGYDIGGAESIAWMKKNDEKIGLQRCTKTCWYHTLY
jgi:hypothetical protein